MDAKEVKELEIMFRAIVEDVLPVAELRVIAEQQKLMLELVNKHNTTLYGNGKEGLTSTVSRIDRWVSNAQKIVDNIVWALVALGGGGIAYALILAVQHGLIK